MDKQQILELNYGINQRKLNYIVKNGKYYAITAGISKKVSSIKDNNKVSLLINDLKINAVATIINDQVIVKDLFDEMTSLENNHFKTYNEVFVALEFTI